MAYCHRENSKEESHTSNIKSQDERKFALHFCETAKIEASPLTSAISRHTFASWIFTAEANRLFSFSMTEGEVDGARNLLAQIFGVRSRE